MAQGLEVVGECALVGGEVGAVGGPVGATAGAVVAGALCSVPEAGSVFGGGAECVQGLVVGLPGDMKNTTQACEKPKGQCETLTGAPNPKT